MPTPTAPTSISAYLYLGGRAIVDSRPIEKVELRWIHRLDHEGERGSDTGNSCLGRARMQSETTLN